MIRPASGMTVYQSTEPSALTVPARIPSAEISGYIARVPDGKLCMRTRPVAACTNRVPRFRAERTSSTSPSRLVWKSPQVPRKPE